MGASFSKQNSVSNPSSTTEAKDKDDIFCDQVGLWYDSCAEVLINCFIQLFPLTDVIGNYIVAALRYVKVLFQVVGLIVRLFCISFSQEIKIEPSKLLQMYDLLMDLIESDSLDERFNLFDRSFTKATHQLETTKDVLKVKIFMRVSRHYLDFTRELHHWIRQSVPKLKKGFMKLKRVKEGHNPSSSSGCEKIPERAIKHLAVSVGKLLLEIRKVTEQNKQPVLYMFF